MSLLLRLNRLSNLRNVIATSPRWISTSPKKSDTATIATAEKISKDDKTEDKNWVSWGWDLEDKEADRNWMNSTFFFSVTIGIVLSGFYLAYTPDNFQRDWSQREAFLVLRQREAAGLPAIIPDYVDPSKINLPSDEELGDRQIII